MTPSLSDYQMLVFNNWDVDALPLPRKEQIEKFVRDGGGLLVIGGERNIYREEKEKKPEDAIDRTFPAKLAPPKSPEGTCVVLIIDKSSSMEGRKMELARLASIGVIENLRPSDQVGVLIFDNSFHWAVPIRRAEDRSTIKRLIAGITPDGGTQIAPALSEAYRKIAARWQHVPSHRASYRRYLGRRRQPESCKRGLAETSHHLDCRPGSGRKPRVSRKGGEHREGPLVFPH